MRNKSIHLIILLALVLPACKKDLSSDETLTVNLEECIQRKSGTESLQLCFDSIVQDSRCPINAACIWQGVAIARFTLRLNGQEHLLELATNSAMPGTRTDTLLQSYHISLRDVRPLPGEPAGKSPYAEVTIEKR